MSETYGIYDLKTGQRVARVEANGQVSEEGDARAIATLRSLLQREITVRESFGPAKAEEEEYDPFPDESMCYFGVVTLQPGEPGHFTAVLRRLPYISYYEARADM
jgi:hypothetical protein